MSKDLKKVLLVVDMQNDFLDVKKGSLNLGHSTSKLQKRVAKFIKDFEGSILLTKDTHKEDSCEFEAFPAHCIEGTWGNEITETLTDALVDKKFLYVSKGSFSSKAVVANLDAQAPVKDVELHVVGVCTHICVHDIVAQYVNYCKTAYNVIPKIIIHEDMIDDFDPEMAAFTLKRLKNLYGVELVNG